jgi:GGDEF domain-containing protein
MWATAGGIHSQCHGARDPATAEEHVGMAANRMGSWVTTGYDALTGLPDRTGFAERTRGLLRTCPPDALVGLCCLDVGSPMPVDDRVLIATAERLSGLTRDVDLLARVGVEEFALLTIGTDLLPGAATEIASHALHLLARPFQIGQHDVAVCTRISVVERVAAETSPEDLMDAADHGMRQARSRHRADWMAVDLDRACAVVRIR